MGEEGSRSGRGLSKASAFVFRRAMLPAAVPAVCGLALVVVGLLGVTADGVRLLVLGVALLIAAVGILLIGLRPGFPGRDAYVVTDDAPGSMAHYGWDGVPVSRDIRLRLIASAQCQEGLVAARTEIDNGRRVAAFAPSLGELASSMGSGISLYVSVGGRKLRIGRVPADFEHPVVAAFARLAAADLPAEIPVDVREQAGGLRAELRIGEIGGRSD